MKKQEGITLIALVITIIVLLILAGVSIAMISGSDGILTKASNAGSDTKVAEAKEAVGLIVSDKMAEFYNKKYVDNDSTVASKTVQAYIKEQLATPGTGDANAGKFKVEEDKTITILTQTSDNKTVTGTIDPNGSLVWTESNS